MQKNTKRLPLGSLELNTGQLDWLPRNPREWSEEDMALMVASLDEDPDFMDDRPPLVVPSLRPGRFVVFGGNMRTDAEKRRATPREDILCIIYFPESEDDRQTVIRRAMKDNGHYGKTDWDVLANEWSDFPLGSWGINVPEGFGAESGGGEGGSGSGGDAHEDDFDEEKDEIHVICAKGDIWQLGDHRLMCGDSIDLEQVKKLMGGGYSNG